MEYAFIECFICKGRGVIGVGESIKCSGCEGRGKMKISSLDIFDAIGIEISSD